MLYYDRIDDSERPDVDMTNESKSSIFVTIGIFK